MSTIKAENAPHGATLTTTTTALAASASASASAGSPFSASIGGLSGLSGSGIAFQLPTNLSINGASAAAAIGGATTATTSGSATTTTTRNNVSVTNIKCEADDLRMCTSSPPAMGANGVTSTSTSTSTTPLNGNLVPVIASTNAGLGIGFSFNGVHHGGGGGCGIRIPVPKAEEDSDSEAELTNIENLKVTRRASAGGGGGGGGGIAGSSSCASALNKNGPRPMSWEGELSEPETTETDLMETENSVSNDRPYLSAGAGDVAGLGGGLTVIKSEATTTAATPATATAPPAHHVVKHELDPISVEVLHASGLMSPYGPAAAAAATGAKVKLAQQLSQPQSDPINLKYEPGLEGGGTNGSAAASTAGLNSPLLARNKSNNSMLPANPSPDSAIHSVYTHSSPSQSPLTSRHAPYTPSLSRNNSDASHSSCYSYSSEFSPTHSPIQGRHSAAAAQAAAAAAAAAVAYGSFNASLHHHSVLYRPISLDSGGSGGGGGGGGSNGALAPLNGEAHNLSSSAPGGRGGRSLPEDMHLDGGGGGGGGGASAGSDAIPSPGISRQQLINSPCPICGDKISGFHYGIFSCESCKGFFKRTVQNRKNYVCVRGGPCPVSISTRKKCPACRFEKCLQKGMKLEAIREDRTRGGRSTYQCSYTLPNSMLSPLLSPADHLQQAAGAPSAATAAGAASSGGQPQTQTQTQQQQQQQAQQHRVALAQAGGGGANGYVTIKTEQGEHAGLNGSAGRIPVLLQEIMDVEHLWQYNEAELARLNQPLTASHSATSSSASSPGSHASSSSSNQIAANPLLASAGLASNGENANPDLIAHLCNVADHRLYKIVKWCKSLPLFKNISIDDQICLLINSWCELLLFSCCFRSIDTPGEIKMSQGKKISLAQAKSSGLQACIERMLNLTDHLRRLRVDRYEYVAMKVIVLLQSDTSELQEPVKVRECQEKALQSLQAYTLAHYPDAPSKFGELLLRIPDLQRTCQLGKEMLTIKSRDGGDFNLLMELLRGEH